MLSVRKLLAGRGLVDYYLGQVRRGLAEYYLPGTSDRTPDRRSPLSAPGSSWWGGGADALGLSGEVRRREFVPLYSKAARPDGGGYLGRKYRLPEQASAARRAALAEAEHLDDAYDRWMAQHQVHRRGWRASVAAWDCTFSPVKSVSLLWAAGTRRIQREVWAAHTTAVDAGLAYLQEHAAYVRAGRNGIRVHDTTGLVVARMNEWTSRDGDMQLHTHCLVLNRAETVDDGKWRALDGRCLLTAQAGAGAIYNRVLEAELTRRLRVAWRDRPDGLRELVGVDDELIELFSTRRRAITARLDEMVAAYEDRYGTEPAPAIVSAMAQDAALQTRRGKEPADAAEALDRWESAARHRGRRLRGLSRRVVGQARGSHSPAAINGEAHVAALLEWLARSRRATFSRHDLVRAALDVLPPGTRCADELHAEAEALATAAMASVHLIGVTAPDVIDAPRGLRRSDGSSMYDRPGRERWALRSTLDEEAWLLEVAAEPSAQRPSADLVRAAVARHHLGDDQAEAVRGLLTANRRIGLLVGPAGAGKTRTLRAVVDAWERTGRQVLGLTVSQAAAQVLASEAEVHAENTAKWLYESRRGTWRLSPEALVIVDEASMVTTSDLVQVVEQVRKVDGAVLMVGDPAQLAAIHIGGAFDLLAERHGAAHLHEARRFVQRWERDASLKLRRRDPAAITEYAMRARIHGGTLDEVEEDVFRAWRADALDLGTGGRQAVLMIVATNEQAAVLGERARRVLQEAGLVQEGRSVALRDNAAGVGDHVVSRRNDRSLVTSSGGFVVNGDVWTVEVVHDNGAATVRRHGDGATVVLPTVYLGEHCHLGYATTAHRAQGMTVDRCHAMVTTDSSHEHVYVAATRGRHANHLWVAVDSNLQEVGDAQDLPSPEHVLTQVLARRDPNRLSAHQVVEDSLTEVSSLARVGAIFEDTARRATEQWLARVVTSHGLPGMVDDPQWPSLVARARELALAGHDTSQLIATALDARPMADAHSATAVLHWRLGALAEESRPGRPRGPLGSLPPIDGPLVDVAVQAGDLMRTRWRDLRSELSAAATLPAWATPLGPKPHDTAEQSAWLTARTAVAAYRERYDVPDHTSMLGPRPTAARPDARSAWEHAQRQVDTYLARPLARCSDRELRVLDDAQRAVHQHPLFNPHELHEAHRAIEERADDRSGRTPPRSVDVLERQAEVHAVWRHAARDARACRRQIALERARRQRALVRIR